MHGTGVCAQALTPDRQLRRMLQARRAGGLPRWKKGEARRFGSRWALPCR
ncbi:hypothetical protein C7S17_2321 [Burkholderia thailandensis]|nr:hypothetical protein [Burkholderia thailandensis]